MEGQFCSSLATAEAQYFSNLHAVWCVPETFPGCTQHSQADTDSLNESGGQLGEYSVDSGQKAAVTDLAPEIPRNVIVLKTLLLLL